MFEVRTPKNPGDLVLSENGRLHRINAKGDAVPHEQPHRRAARERAARFRARVQPVAEPPMTVGEALIELVSIVRAVLPGRN